MIEGFLASAVRSDPGLDRKVRKKGIGRIPFPQVGDSAISKFGGNAVILESVAQYGYVDDSVVVIQKTDVESAYRTVPLTAPEDVEEEVPSGWTLADEWNDASEDPWATDSDAPVAEGIPKALVEFESKWFRDPSDLSRVINLFDGLQCPCIKCGPGDVRTDVKPLEKSYKIGRWAYDGSQDEE